MHIELSFLSFIEILTFSVALMLGLLFFTMKSANKKANIFLGLFLWLLSLNIFIDVIDYEIEEFSTVDIVLFQILLCIPFLLYMYTCQTINKPYKRVLLFLYLPLFCIDVMLLYIIRTETSIVLVDLMHYLIEIVLYIMILKKIKNLRSELNSFYSDLENKRLSWIVTIVYISLAFIVFDSIEIVLDLDEETVDPILDPISVILAFIMVYWIAYNGFSQSEVFKGSLFLTDSSDLSNQKSIQKTMPIDKKEKEHFDQIKNRIVIDKLYVNPELNLRVLSQSLQLKEKELSKLINTYSGTNFYHFINKLRVEEFKRLLKTPKAQQLSNIGLAKEAGFLSKSTFYSVFKSLEGVTPKQYERSIKNNTN
ncbi:helix-turn-helix domain-containing protein [Aquimarina sp. AU474]|uniref:AraC family transcriptional regulator n=1 Tax=Aquimarina sp. AU474 TaxID=2108529 RepID=UPI000D6998B6|nr:helix-turn-helix domain-containing protein [Aquimarina sp. AU474]